MAFNLRPFGEVYEKLMYNSTCSVFRIGEDVSDPFGGTTPGDRKEVYKDIPCKFSFRNVDNPSDSNEANLPIKKEVVVFMSLDQEVVAGDIISGLNKDITSGIEELIEGICGAPNRFQTHQEIVLAEKGEN